MNDIVPFLRSADSATRDQLVSLAGKAADEIERLQIQLEAEMAKRPSMSKIVGAT